MAVKCHFYFFAYFIRKVLLPFNNKAGVLAFICSRACLKIAFWQLCVTLCGRFVPDEGRVAGYVT